MREAQVPIYMRGSLVLVVDVSTVYKQLLHADVVWEMKTWCSNEMSARKCACSDACRPGNLLNTEAPSPQPAKPVAPAKGTCIWMHLRVARNGIACPVETQGPLSQAPCLHAMLIHCQLTLSLQVSGSKPHAKPPGKREGIEGRQVGCRGGLTQAEDAILQRTGEGEVSRHRDGRVGGLEGHAPLCVPLGLQGCLQRTACPE